MTIHLWPWLWRWLLDWGILVGSLTLAWWSHSWLVWGLCAVVVSTRQHALGILGHEAIHGVACASPVGNASLAVLCFWPLGLSVSGYEAFHMTHHALTRRPGDPELELYEHPCLRWQWRWPLTWPRLLLCGVWDLVFGWMAWLSKVGGLWRRGGDAEGALLFLAHLIVMSACGMLGAWPLVIVWYGSLVTTFWWWFRLRAWTEHQEPGVVTSHLARPAWWRQRLYLEHGTWCHDAHHADVEAGEPRPGWALAAGRASGPG